MGRYGDLLAVLFGLIGVATTVGVCGILAAWTPAILVERRGVAELIPL